MRSMPKLVATLAFGLVATGGYAWGEPLSTERHVHGTITIAEPDAVTISVAPNRTVVGRVQPGRTKITLNGKPATVADLKPSIHAKAELCLEEVWIKIDAHESH